MAQERECRVADCGARPSDAHHVYYRSRGGDDAEDNIVGLCHEDHMTLHFDASDENRRVREQVGLSLTEAELAYPLRKLGLDAGAEFLWRDYGVARERLNAIIIDRPSKEA